MEGQTQNSTDPRQILAHELDQWWNSNHGFRLRQDLAHRVGVTPGMLSSYFAGRTFPTLPICEKLYAETKISSLEPHKAAETIGQLRSERAAKIHTPEVNAKIADRLRKKWADKPRSVAHLHTPEMKTKARERADTPEAKKRHSEGIRASYGPDRRNEYARRREQQWSNLKAELARLREVKKAISQGRRRKDDQRRRVRELQAQGMNWAQITAVVNSEFNETSSVRSYQDLLRVRDR